MTVMDLTIVNTALPTIGRKLHFSESSLLWVVTAYGLAYGGFLLLGGRAADLLGRRRMIMVGLGVFTAASLGASLAGSEPVLIAMRAIQGLGAAAFLPAALSTVRNMFSEGAERNKALGIWGALSALGALQAGFAWSSAAITSMLFAGLSQLLVTKGSAKLVMAFGMSVLGLGIIWSTQAPVHGHFWANLFAITRRSSSAAA
jgi:MFS family permease